MLALDALPVSSLNPTPIRRAAAGKGGALADVFAALGVENQQQWAWDNYKRVVRALASQQANPSLLEVGGGRDPLFDRNEIAGLGAMTINDISPRELAVLPQGYRTACFDVAGDIAPVKHLRGSFDLAFSRMVFEHVADGERAWANLYDLLAPGGIALAFVPTLYSLPFVINKLLPDKLAAQIVKRLYPNRTDDGDPVFPARYSWCFADERRVGGMLSRLGYKEIVVLPFYGHEYYVRFPLIREANDWFTGLARRHDWRMIATHAYIAARK